MQQCQNLDGIQQTTGKIGKGRLLREILFTISKGIGQFVVEQRRMSLVRLRHEKQEEIE